MPLSTIDSTGLSSPLTGATLSGPTISGAVVSAMASSVITQGTAQASTSGTSIDFTSIPSWVKRITVMFSGVSTNGTSLVQIQIGAGSVTTTGYTCSMANIQGSGNTAVISQTTGFGIYQNNASEACSGSIVLTLVGSNVWVASGNLSNQALVIIVFSSAGNVTLGGALDRVRITTVNGTDTFDAGSVNIQYE